MSLGCIYALFESWTAVVCMCEDRRQIALQVGAAWLLLPSSGTDSAVAAVGQVWGLGYSPEAKKVPKNVCSFKRVD